ncbi:MAG: hypothetical protein J6S89_09960 [Paludibacteraceae bacterium]|nr:hypothetical protein [Paludibacteraceae bacterium]
MDDKQKYNAFRVAAASSDGGYTVDTHFGRATDFYIYQFFEGDWVYVEKRSVKPVCQGGGHSPIEMEKTIELFHDCQYITASRIGAGAASLMTQKGIVSMALPGDLIEALNKIYSYNEIQNLF